MEAMQTIGIPLVVFCGIAAIIIKLGEYLERKGILQRWSGVATA